MSVKLQDAYEISNFIKNAEKKTPVKLYANGDLSGIDRTDVKVFGSNDSAIIFGDVAAIDQILENHGHSIDEYELEYDRRNSAIPLLDTRHIDARIEPGAIIRDQVEIGKHCVIMMGSVINIGAVVGAKTMIDMNVVIGARGTIGENCHIGAGTVIAGVLEPPSKQPVIIEDDVVIGANAVIMEGVRVKKGAVVAAGAMVTKDVEAGTVVAGTPARYIKDKDEQTSSKTHILDELRG